MKKEKMLFYLILTGILLLFFGVIYLFTIIGRKAPELYSFGKQDNTSYTILMLDSQLTDWEIEQFAPTANLTVSVSNSSTIREYVDSYSESCAVYLLAHDDSHMDRFAKNLLQELKR